MSKGLSTPKRKTFFPWRAAASRFAWLSWVLTVSETSSTWSIKRSWRVLKIVAKRVEGIATINQRAVEYIAVAMPFAKISCLAPESASAKPSNAVIIPSTVPMRPNSVPRLPSIAKNEVPR